MTRTKFKIGDYNAFKDERGYWTAFIDKGIYFAIDVAFERCPKDYKQINREGGIDSNNSILPFEVD